MTETVNAKVESKRHRSPAYPGISLKKAVERAREFWQREKKHAAPITVAASHWGFQPKSSGGLVTVAALKQFGFLQDAGSGDERKVQLTDAAHRIVLDEREVSEERDQLLSAAALRPKIHAELWKRWGADLPSDATIKSFLVLEREFNPTSVVAFIREYRETIAYAKLSESDTVSVNDGDSESESIDSGMGAPMTDLGTQERPGGSASAGSARSSGAGGERELMRLPFDDGLVRLIFSGPKPTPGQIKKLITVLELMFLPEGDPE